LEEIELCFWVFNCKVVDDFTFGYEAYFYEIQITKTTAIRTTTLKHNPISSNCMKSLSTTKTCFNGCDMRDSKEREKKKNKMSHCILKVCEFLG
jgi:hypothetical protein